MLVRVGGKDGMKGTGQQLPRPLGLFVSGLHAQSLAKPGVIIALIFWSPLFVRFER